MSTWIWRKARKAVEQQLASEESGQHATAQPAEAPKAEQTKAEAPALPEAPASVNVYVSLAGRNGVQMQQHHNAKGTWWSHKTTEGWCHGK
jgi:hypothetical protein